MRFPFIGKRPPVNPDIEKEGDRPLPTDAEVQAYLSNGPKRAEGSTTAPTNLASGIPIEAAPVSQLIAAKPDTRVLVGAGELKG